MADQWRLGSLSGPAKRSRTDYGSYIPSDRFDDGRPLWRDPENIGGTNNLLRNGMAYGPPGIPPSDYGLGAGPGIGAGSYGSLGVPGLGDPGITAGHRPLPETGLGLHGGRQEHPLPLGASSMLPPDASPTLFVEGLPSDTTRREASHIFRPFIGFKEVRLVHKESKRIGGEKLILCFVDFTDARCSATALEALQGYKFDENDRDSPTLKLQFARFLGPRGGPRNDFRGGRDHDDSFRFQGNRR